MIHASAVQIFAAGCSAVVLLLSLTTSHAQAAAISDSEFSALQQQITRPGQSVHVAVVLTRLSLGDMAGGDPAKVADTRVRESRYVPNWANRLCRMAAGTTGWASSG